jgi:hypothetical protein
LIEISKLDAVLVKEEELINEPYNGKTSFINENKDPIYHGVKDSLSVSESKKYKSDTDKQMKGSKQEVNNSIGEKSEHFRDSKWSCVDRSFNADNSQLSWVRSGIRVRIVTKKLGEKYYLKKAIVVDVHDRKLSSVQFEDGTILEVKERYLETVLPAVGENCLILKGKYIGCTARLLEKRKEKQQVIVQLDDDLDVLIISADDVAAHFASEIY